MSGNDHQYKIESDKLQSCVREQLKFEFYRAYMSAAGVSPERLGTFQDNLRAPIHRWFKYPAGFSYRLVEALIDDKNLAPGNWLLDPFVGCGTTSVVAKEHGINSLGIEAHPFVWWVARVKCFWEYDMQSLQRSMLTLIRHLHQARLGEMETVDRYPALVHKCYSPVNLQRLDFIRDAISRLDCSDEERDFFLLALTDTLRTASKAGTGWPYIAPNKYHEKQERDAIEVFCHQVQMMYKDLSVVQERRQQYERVECRLLQMDARQPYPVESESMDLAITSPPYLNNYDYADRTRLEMYFLGWAQSWGDITDQVRDKLIIAATTQIRRSAFPDDPLSHELQELAPRIHAELSDKIRQLEKMRLHKGGKKSYDLMVAGYFNDMFQVLKQVYRVMKKGSEFVLVLGDSAPYGVYIPTEEYLGALGLAVGFGGYRIRELRERGGKWGHNPQRHKVMLKESLLTLVK
ncbi:MAG: DNA methyltransferase [Anaerolineae bacterium]|nr:DNA methyltransferase [Anaerolineae bacterium]